MKKIHEILQVFIDVFAVFIVLDSFLRFVGIVDVLQKNAVVYDYIFILVLALDLWYRYYQSDDRKQFIRDSWLEFLSLIPTLPGMRLFRLFRIVRKSKVNRFFLMVRELLTTNSLHRTLGVVILLALVGGSLFYRAESASQALSLGDAIWFSFVTMTTVGYGDISPLTFSGRMIALILMIIGMGFLGILTGNIASFFIKRSRRMKDPSKKRLEIDMSDLSHHELEQVKDYVDYIRHKRS